MTIKHEDYINERLQDIEFQQLYLKESILAYIEDGDYSAFYKALEQVIKARTTVKQFAEQIGMHRANLVEILDGLGYTLSVDLKVS